ncbi:MAG: hypothetical protein LBT20_07985 [Clostridiales bacterium]|jgi:hypothetical protein|nr:hypothetical protein [Clostridiales bacterium]
MFPDPAAPKSQLPILNLFKINNPFIRKKAADTRRKLDKYTTKRVTLQAI